MYLQIEKLRPTFFFFWGSHRTYCLLLCTRTRRIEHSLLMSTLTLELTVTTVTCKQLDRCWSTVPFQPTQKKNKPLDKEQSVQCIQCKEYGLELEMGWCVSCNEYFCHNCDIPKVCPGSQFCECDPRYTEKFCSHCLDPRVHMMGSSSESYNL